MVTSSKADETGASVAPGIKYYSRVRVHGDFVVQDILKSTSTTPYVSDKHPSNLRLCGATYALFHRPRETTLSEPIII